MINATLLTITLISLTSWILVSLNLRDAIRELRIWRNSTWDHEPPPGPFRHPEPEPPPPEPDPPPLCATLVRRPSGGTMWLPCHIYRGGCVECQPERRAQQNERTRRMQRLIRGVANALEQQDPQKGNETEPPKPGMDTTGEQNQC